MKRSESMDYKEIISELQKLGDPRAIKVWERFGMNAENYLGVNLTKLKELAKSIGKDHQLADRLWHSGIHDAMLLATMVEDQKKVTEEQIDAWIIDIEFVDLCDKFFSNIVSKTAFAYKKMKRWMKAEMEYQKRAGFMLLTILAKKDEWLSDEDYSSYLIQIEREIHTERNWVKEAMNYALIAIGSHNKNLNIKALEAAENIGVVKVDYGDSSCKVPDALKKLNDKKLQDKLNIRMTG